MNLARLDLRELGPVARADLSFGDLTVFTGPQASGKSVALQTLKLALDRRAVTQTMSRRGLEWGKHLDAFLDVFYGSGMSSLVGSGTRIQWDGSPLNLKSIASYTWRRGHAESQEVLSYIPAQRVMSVRDGWTRPFNDYLAGDPYVLREFSQRVHDIVQGELSASDLLFPRQQRFNEPLRAVVTKHVLGGYELAVDVDRMQRRFVLRNPAHREWTGLPFLAWSAGQREFVPLLLGLYYLLPAGKVARRNHLDWVVVEEPEMGLHPQAIAATMAFVLEMLRRQYRVVLSTHSTQVLDVAWGLRTVAANGGSPSDVLEMLGLASTPAMVSAAEMALRADIRTYYFEQGAPVKDISGLDPIAEDPMEAGWGGLTAFSDAVANVVSRVIRQHGREDTIK